MARLNGANLKNETQGISEFYVNWFSIGTEKIKFGKIEWFESKIFNFQYAPKPKN